MADDYELDFETIEKLRKQALEKNLAKANIVDGDIVEEEAN